MFAVSSVSLSLEMRPGPRCQRLYRRSLAERATAVGSPENGCCGLNRDIDAVKMVVCDVVFKCEVVQKWAKNLKYIKLSAEQEKLLSAVLRLSGSGVYLGCRHGDQIHDVVAGAAAA